MKTSVKRSADSAGSETMGGSGFFSKEWVFFQWPQNWIDLGILKDITFLEFVPIVLSIAIWGSRLQNKKVNFYKNSKNQQGTANPLK
jgi:hypothetical protein